MQSHIRTLRIKTVNYNCDLFEHDQVFMDLVVLMEHKCFVNTCGS